MTKKFISSVILIQSALFWGCSHLGSDRSDQPRRVIDVHTHTYFNGERERSSGIPYTKESFLAELKSANVVAAVSHENKEGKEQPELKEGVIISCGAIEEKVEISKVERNLKSGRWKCLKLYLGYVYRYAYDPIYAPAYRLAEKYDVPVIFHTGDTYSSKGLLKYADPMTIDEVAVKYPKVRFVIAHMGNPWIQTAAQVAYKNPNVYIEASAMMIGDLKSDESQIALNEYMIQPIRWAFGYVDDPSKFMFGSDWPLVSIKDYLDAYKKAIPKEHWDLVFYQNAVKVFKLDLPSNSSIQ